MRQKFLMEPFLLKIRFLAQFARRFRVVIEWRFFVAFAVESLVFNSQNFRHQNRFNLQAISNKESSWLL